MTARGINALTSGVRLRLRSLAALSGRRGFGLVRDAIGGAVSRTYGKLRRKTGLYLVRGIEKTMGSDRAHHVFWRLWSSARSWPNIESRLSLLSRENPGAIAKFVEISLAQNTDPNTLIGLARNAHSSVALANCLRALTISDDSPMAARLKVRLQYTATFVSVVQLLLNEEDAKCIVGQALAQPRAINESFVNIVCSAGTRTAAPTDGLYRQGVLDSGFRNPVEHRLIIVEDHKDINAVAQLFLGAHKVTILAVTDLFGRADYSRFTGLGGVEEIVVEHLRTRVSRFSQAYVANHEYSRDAGQAIAQALQEQPGLLAADLSTYMALAIADFLHFQCLKIAAVSALLDDADFDHIAIAAAGQVPTSEYFRLFSAVPGIASDPRIELVSIARYMTPKTNFCACLATMTSRNTLPQTRVSLSTDLAMVLGQIRQEAAKISLPTPERGISSEPQVFMFTANYPAYNAATAHYAGALAETNRVEIIHVGLRALALQAELQTKSEKAAGLTITPIAGAGHHRMEWTQRALADVIWTARRAIPDNAAAHILAINTERVVNECIIPQLIIFSAIDAWFGRMQQMQNLPDLVALSPARAASLAVVAPIARRYGVPSLTLEAHGLNANYSRYIKVTADFYGVMSEYFRKDAVNGFGIPEDRIAVIGTPRIVAPAGHDPQLAKINARQGLEDEQKIPFGQRRGTVSFFCQPSAWSHVAQVWASILKAAAALDLNIMLKLHPEETLTRQAAYLALARELDVSDHVVVVTGPPDVIISASDVVLTGYSTAAMDAAVLQVPVICVTEGAVDYPLDQHSMVDAPLVRNTDELRTALVSILSDPAAAQERSKRFLAREHQFVEGPDDRIRAFVSNILARPQADRVRTSEAVAASVFLDSPHPIFPV